LAAKVSAVFRFPLDRYGPAMTAQRRRQAFAGRPPTRFTHRDAARLIFTNLYQGKAGRACESETAAWEHNRNILLAPGISELIAD
jgi:hypothetical protein